MPERSPSQNYIQTYPTDQNAIDIFKSEWSSKFPESFGVDSGAVADLFNDQRIIWAEQEGVNFEDKSILELGPLEAGHTWMMDQRGAREILAIEAHERAYLKCLVVKEIGKITSARFLHGNFDEYLTTNKQKFDICLASGVLYHSTNPTNLLDQICNCCSTIILWTHYYDNEAILKHGPALLQRFQQPSSITYKGLKITHYPFCYEEEASRDAFCGGLASNSIWLEKSDIELVLETNGFNTSAYGFNHPHHPNGPAIALIANKPQ